MGSEEVEKQKNTTGGLVKTIARAVSSHVGLCLLVIVYCIAGGLMFEMLERENEIRACKEARKEYMLMENDTLISLLDVIINNQLGSKETDVQIVGVFESFRNNSFSIGYDGSWCEGFGKPNGPMHEWNLAGGIFFSMTVMTTIGYGHIAPKTVWGRIAFISYAMLGIPIMLLFLTNVGDVLADVFKYVYAKILCCGCLRKKRLTKRAPPTRTEPHNETSTPDSVTFESMANKGQVNMGVLAMVLKAAVKWPTPPKTTTNPADKSNEQVPVVKNSKVVRFADDEGITEPPTDTETRSQITRRTTPQNTTTKPSVPADTDSRVGRIRSVTTRSTDRLVIDEEIDDEDAYEDDWEEISKIAVPLTISLGIIGLYIVGGAVLFKYWEGWDMLQSAYFCFITLSTIGFGDVTPGRDYNDPTANARLIIGSVYSIFGMAILSMCFTLMQEEMVAKSTWLGQQLGVLETGDEVGPPVVKTKEKDANNQSDC